MGEGPVYLLFVYLCGGDGGTTLDSQSGFSPAKGGSPQSLGPHSQRPSPEPDDQQQQRRWQAAVSSSEALGPFL